MTRSDRLKPVSDVAHARERQAATELGEAQRQLSAAQARLDELIGYRNEYTERLNNHGRTGMDAQQLADQHGFLSRLNDAITYQERQVGEARARVGQAQTRWNMVRRKADALDKVVTRYRNDEQRAASKAEQKAADERANRLNRPALGSKKELP